MARWKPTRRFWGGYKGLYGDNAELPIPNPLEGKKSPSRAKLKVPSEQQEQFWFAAWLRKQNIWHYHVPNGGRRDYAEAAKFKRLGVSAGVPDIVIPYVVGGKPGLYIEMKRTSGGKLSDHQERWRDFLISQGYEWHEAKGAKEAIRITAQYLDIKETGIHENKSNLCDSSTV